MKIAKLFTLLLSVLVMGCVSTREVLDSWLGKSEDELISVAGIPTNSLRLNNGTKIVEYTSVVVNYQDGAPIENRCVRTFTVDADGIITFWRQRGSCLYFVHPFPAF